MTGKARKPRRKQAPRYRMTEAEFERRLLNDPRFLKRIESARKSVRAGRCIRLEDIE